jgi:hypothetical protein
VGLPPMLSVVHIVLMALVDHVALVIIHLMHRSFLCARCRCLHVNPAFENCKVVEKLGIMR